MTSWGALRRALPLSVSGIGRRLWLGLLIGLVAGAGAIVFNLACSAAIRAFLGGLAGFVPARPAGEELLFAAPTGAFTPWLLPLVAALGGLLAGLVVWRFAPEARGHGTDAAIEAYHERDGRISSRVPLVKLVASALTIGSGGSGGREGPIAQIGAGFGSWLSDRLGLSPRERRMLVASGMGAGVGSIFHAPLAGALFAAEIFYSEAEFESEALIPAAVATIIAYSVFSLVSGFEPLFATPDFAFHPVELLLYAVVAVAVALAAALFVKIFYAVHDRCERLPIVLPIRAALGGAVTGAIGLALLLLLDDVRALDVLSFGYGTLQQALLGEAGLGLLAVLALGKMLTTSISIGSGGSGGVFGPSMVIGGSVGGIVGLLGQRLLPDVVVHPGSYVLVGMAGFFSAAGKAPISTLVMVSEMTGNYRLIVPALWVSSLAFLLGRPFRLYRSQVPTRLESGAHRHEVDVDLLGDIRVADLIAEGRLARDIASVPETMPLDAIVTLFTRTTQHYFPVVDDSGAMTGILSANDVRQMVEDRDVGAVVIAADIATTEVVRVTPETDLDSALQRFVRLDVGELPVVEAAAPDRVIGMLSRRDLIHAYNAARERFRRR